MSVKFDIMKSATHRTYAKGDIVAIVPDGNECSYDPAKPDLYV